MHVISKTTGRLGNAIFRYFASIMFLKNNPSFKYVLYDDIKDNLYDYYHGKDFEGNDIGYDSTRNIHLLKNGNYEAFNTLGYIKQNIDVSKLVSNAWINSETNHGLYVRKPVSIIDESIFHEKLAVPLDKSCMLHQWYQFDGIYLENKQYILDYIQAHKHEHHIQTDEPIKYLMKDVVDPMLLPPNKLYEVVIHIRLGDFNGRPDFIEYEYMEKVFDTLLEKDEFRGRTALCIEPPRTAEDKQYLGKCLSWFKERNIEITCESNSLFVDFNIMRQAKIVVSSMSTLCWTAVFLSKSIEKCYMPDYDFSMDPGRKYTQFKTPIHNTEFYQVKTTKLHIFNNCNPKTNGEEYFIKKITPYIDIIFDVGCRQDSEFLEIEKEVHYFDPMKEFIENIQLLPNKNKKSFFNNFGLSNKTEDLYYYPKYQSFYDRVVSCGESNAEDKIVLNVKTASDYILEKNILAIDFLKIDTEGFEFNVIKGFGNFIKNIKIIQFEYGGTFLDNNVKLSDVIDYLTSYGFCKFSYLTPTGHVDIKSFIDHYQYCNIVCFNSTFQNELLI